MRQLVLGVPVQIKPKNPRFFVGNAEAKIKENQNSRG